ncbi:primosomal protein N' [Kribbella sp. NPDC056345]|uniref:primosomal protein N' n=1 Tax=Kribbella sp. NPDC056345 TaxID=3345789 RepID=UPI0035DD68F5
MTSEPPEQLTLLRDTVRKSRTKEPAGITSSLPVARIAVDVSLPHLDRPFDYLVPDDLAAAAQPGARVKVRFAGKDLDGFVLERLAESDHDGKLSRIRKVVSPEQVLTPEIADLCRAVADRYAGVFPDVTRLAVPPRHAKVEAEPLRCDQPPPPPLSTSRSAWSPYPSGFLDAVARSETPRAIWTAVPGADWPLAFAQAAAVCSAAGRGALLLAPDARDLKRLEDACTAVLGNGGFVTLSADLGPTARYRAFLAALRGNARVVIGTRAAAFAPVANLGLVAMWDDGDDSYAEARAPYPHAREVLLLRAFKQNCAALLGGFARSAEAAAVIESGFAGELIADRTVIRAAAPEVHITGESDRELARDPAARAARLPHRAFEIAREGLLSGPVLVQNPRAGYLPSLVCQTCRAPSRCATCAGTLRLMGRTGPASCSICGRPAADHRCPECGDPRMRAAVVGARRTAEELGRAFPGIVVRTSGSEHMLDHVSDKPALIVATPGSEPVADGGYTAALLLDTWLMLSRPDLRAPEEAVRRWLNAAALVRPARAGGTVILVGDPSALPLQAVVRWSPEGWATREVEERRTARLAPAAKLAELTGPSAAVTDLIERLRPLLQPEAGLEVLGPVDVDDETVRAVVRTPRTAGTQLVRALKEAQAARTTKKNPGSVRIQIDPPGFG